MRAMVSNSNVTEDGEQIVPLIVQVHREQVAPKVQQAQRESNVRGSHPSGFGGEEKPPKLVQKKLDFRGSLPSGPDGREASFETVRMVSWVEEARQEA
jgi:hypothetical protein